MLARRRSRWANIGPALGQRLKQAASACTIETAGQTERDIHTEQTEVNQHVPHLCVQRGRPNKYG